MGIKRLSLAEHTKNKDLKGFLEEAWTQEVRAGNADSGSNKQALLEAFRLARYYRMKVSSVMPEDMEFIKQVQVFAEHERVSMEVNLKDNKIEFNKNSQGSILAQPTTSTERAASLRLIS